MAIDFIDDSWLDRATTTFVDSISACTFMAWVKSDVTNTDKGWMTFRSPGSGDAWMSMRFDSSGNSSGNTNLMKFAVGINPASPTAHAIETSDNTQTTDWIHVAVRWTNGTDIEAYFDAVKDTGNPLVINSNTGDFLTGYTPLNVGRGPLSSGGDWDGQVEDIRIYDRYLSVNEIETIYNLRGNDRIHNNLLARYLMAEASPGTSVPATSDYVKDTGNTASHHLTRSGTSAPSYSDSMIRINGRRR